jgi:hypothetical protein
MAATAQTIRWAEDRGRSDASLGPRAFDPPTDPQGRAAYTKGFTDRGGKIPKKDQPKVVRVRSRMADPTGEQLRLILIIPAGRAMVRHFALTFAGLLRDRGEGRVSVRLALELARATYRGPDDHEGTYKWNNNLAPALARWILICRPALRGAIELRGEPDPAWSDPSLPAPESPFAWLDPERPYYPRDGFLPDNALTGVAWLASEPFRNKTAETWERAA